MAATGADRGLAWDLLERLYQGPHIREDKTEPYAIKIVRICGLSEKMTGSQGLTYVLCLGATLLWLPFCLQIVTATI